MSAPPLGEAPSTQGLSPFSVLTSASDGAEDLFPSSNRRRDSNTSFINSRVHIHSAAPLTPRASPLSSFYRLRLQIASLPPRRPPTTSTTATTTCCFSHGASRLSTSSSTARTAARCVVSCTSTRPLRPLLGRCRRRRGVLVVVLLPRCFSRAKMTTAIVSHQLAVDPPRASILADQSSPNVGITSLDV